MKTICVYIDGTIGKVLPHCAESLQELKIKEKRLVYTRWQN